MNILLSKINGSAKIIKEKVANIIKKPNVLGDRRKKRKILDWEPDFDKSQLSARQDLCSGQIPGGGRQAPILACQASLASDG